MTSALDKKVVRSLHASNVHVRVCATHGECVFRKASSANEVAAPRHSFEQCPFIHVLHSPSTEMKPKEMLRPEISAKATHDPSSLDVLQHSSEKMKKCSSQRNDDGESPENHKPAAETVFNPLTEHRICYGITTSVEATVNHAGPPHIACTSGLPLSRLGPIVDNIQGFSTLPLKIPSILKKSEI